MGFLSKLGNAFRRRRGPTPEQRLFQILSPVAGGGMALPSGDSWTGEKFDGGFFDRGGSSIWDWTDYETLRARSEQLFQRNPYGRGLLRRLITNVVHTGLQLEAIPVETVIGRPEDSMADWAEDVEQRFNLWANTKLACHHKGELTWGQIQAQVLMEALVQGDCLMVLRQDRRTQLPTVDVVPASGVQGSASASTPRGNRVDYGVERDARGSHVAFHVVDYSSGKRTSTRIPAYDSQGRKQAWMVYGTKRRVRTVRGEPLLAIVLQSLKEIDAYRDSAQRKATVNSLLAMFIRKDKPGVGTNPITNGSTAYGEDEVESTEPPSREFNISRQIPGVVLQELAEGEVPVGMDSRGIDTSFGEFEASVIAGVCWSLEIPPEIGQLSFSSNYSASQAALNEFNMFLSRERAWFGADVCQPVYADWLLSQGLRGSVDVGSYLRCAGNPAEFEVCAAWTRADWAGAVKPTTDPRKQTQALILQINEGLTTRELATKELNGRKYSLNVRKLKRENDALREAREALGPASGEIQSASPTGEAPPGEDPDDKEDEEDKGDDEK